MLISKHKEDSFLKMYGFKLSASIIIIIFNTVVQMILARALGTTDYGYFNYNMNLFTTAISLINASTSDAFYSKISKRRDEKELTQFYLYYTLLLFAVINIIFILLLVTGLVNYIWENQQIINLLLALYVTFLIYILSVFSSLSDAYSLTRFTELGKAFQKLIVFIFTSVFFYFSSLNLTLFYLFQVVSMVFVIIILFIVLKHKKIIFFKKIKFIELLHKYKFEFYLFSKPMFLMLLINSILTSAENWFIIHYSSVSEQAYFGIANQLNSALSYIFTPLILLLIREFATVYSDKNKLSEIYEKYMRIIYIVIAFFACYIMVDADWITSLFGGNEYLPAVPAVKLMMIYTIGQTMGQINGSLFIASERTKVFSYTAFVGIVLSIVLDYLLLVPNYFYSKGLGAVGLTLKMFLTQLIVYNLSIYLNCKYLKISFRKIFAIQFISPIIFLSCGYAIRYVICLLVDVNIIADNYALLCLLTGLIYFAIILLMVSKAPKLLGLKSNYLKLLLDKIKVQIASTEG